MSTNPEESKKPQQMTGEVPTGYRQAIVSAITVLLGFSLLFLRFFNFEMPGDWSFSSRVAAMFLGLSIIVQCGTLARALRPEDDELSEYRKTLRWFIRGLALLMLSLFCAVFSSNDF